MAEEKAKGCLGANKRRWRPRWGALPKQRRRGWLQQVAQLGAAPVWRSSRISIRRTYSCKSPIRQVPFFPSYLSPVSLHTLLFLYGFLIVLSHLSWIASILGHGTHLYRVKRHSFYGTMRITNNLFSV